MTTTVISSPRRGRHPPGLVTVAKHLLRLLVLLVVLITSAAADTHGQDGEEPIGEHATYIYSCDDLVMDRTVVRGSVVFMGDIICADTKAQSQLHAVRSIHAPTMHDFAVSERIIEVAQGYGDVLIFAETIMWTKGVIFEIPQDTRVDFGAAAFVFVSNEDNMDGIFHVDGILGFHAVGHDFEAPDDATPEDPHRMVRGAPGGTVLALGDEAMYFTDSAVFVIEEPSTDKNDNSNSNSEAAGGSQGHSAGLAQEQLERELEASGLDLVTYLTSCDDLPNERTPFEGMVSVTADIVCPEPKVIEIAKGGSNVLFVAVDALYTKNVRFSVRKGEKMHIRAPALTFEREQDDPHDTIHGSPDGDIITYGVSTLRFSETSVIVDAAPADTDTYDNGSDNNNNFVGQGDSAEFFTVEPQGHLGPYADTVGPLPDDGTAELVKEGGALDVDGEIRQTASVMRAVLVFDVQQPEERHTVPIRQLDETVEQSEEQQISSIRQLFETVRQPEDQHTVPIPQLHTVPIAQLFENGDSNNPPTSPAIRPSPTPGDEHSTVANADTGVNSNDTPKTTGTATATEMSRLTPALAVVDDVLPLYTLESCNELRFERTPIQGVSGVLLLDDDIVCTEKRILEVDHDVIVVSDKPDLRLKGVHFVVHEKVSLTFVVATMVLEKIEGESGELFTVEPQGVLAMSADKWSPSPEIGTEEDVHSLVALKGGTFELDGKASFTASTMTISMRNKNEEKKLKNNDNEDNRGTCQSTVEHPSTATDDNHNAAAPGNADAGVIDVTSGGGHAYSNSISTTPRFHDDAEWDKLPRRNLGSCDELALDRNPPHGRVFITGDIVCDVKRVIEIRTEAMIYAAVDDLYVRGVQFHVEQTGGLGIMVGAMTMEALEGDSAEFITVEPQGHLGMFADSVGRLPDDSMAEDKHSRVLVKAGGALDVDGQVRYTASGMRFVHEFEDQQPEDQQRYSIPQLVETVEQPEDQQRVVIPQLVETAEQPEEQPRPRVPIPQLLENGENNTPPVPPFLRSSLNQGATHHTAGRADSGGNSNASQRAKRHRRSLSLDGMHHLPLTAIDSCEHLRFDRTTVLGILTIEGDIVCEEKRTIEVSDEAVIVSNRNPLHFKGVHFHVHEKASLRFGFSIMLVENLEGDSSEIFTIEPEGYVGLHPTAWGPLPEDGTKKDAHSLVNIKKGGELFVGAEVRYTASSMKVAKTPVAKDLVWIQLQRLRRRWLEQQYQQRLQQLQQHRQQEDGDRGASAAAGSPPYGDDLSPFSPERYAKYTFEERLKLTPTYLMAGEELRFPSRMTSLDRRHVMTVGSDGSLVLANIARYHGLRREVKRAFHNWSSRAAQSSVDILAGLSPNYAGEDRGLDLKVLASPDVVQAMRSHDDRLTREKKRQQRQQSDLGEAKEEAEKERSPPLQPDSPAAAQGQGDGEGIDLREIDDESTAEGYSSIPPTGKEQDRNTNDHAGHADQGTPTSSTSSTTSGTSTTGGDQSSSSSREGAADMPKAISSTPERYWGDDVVLKVTDMGDVLVTVGDRVVVQKLNPNRKVGWVKKLGESRPAKMIKGIFRSLGRRGKRDKSDNDNDNDNENNTRDNKNRDDKGAVRSTLYSLHVVENGVEIRLGGVFVWGWNVK
ncbi:unnamed protein product [Ectocarpus sp. CCAP 1310/34]|nr:unnamed protein product [Ectocarpus sp. CCAP 1310/34]